MKKSIFKTILCANVPGSFTIEAAIIYPLTIVLIFSFIFMSFYLHDKIIARSALITSIYSGHISLSDDFSSEYINEYVSQSTDKYSIMGNTYSLEKLSADDFSYSIHIKHDNTFIPYIDSTTEVSASLGGGNICRKINFYQSLYSLSKETKK